MSRMRTFRIDDFADDELQKCVNESGVSFSEFMNMMILDRMKSLPHFSKDLKFIEHRIALKRYKRERRQKMELRHEIYNIFRKIFQSSMKDSFNGLPTNIIQINSFIDEFSKLWKTYPDDLKLELNDAYKKLASLKHPSALHDFLRHANMINFGEKNAEARRRIRRKR